MSDTAKSLLELQEEFDKLARQVALLRYKQWEKERLASPGKNGHNEANFYDLGDGKEPSVVAVVYGERLKDAADGATVRVVEGRNEYRLKVALVRPHGLDYEARGPLTLVSVKKPKFLESAGTVILSAKAFTDTVISWRETNEPIPLPARTKQAR